MKRILGLLLFVFVQTCHIRATILTGSCGDNANFVLNDDGSFCIYGTGEMSDYTSTNKRPWYSVLSKITSVKINDGITSIGDSSFSGCSNLVTVIFPQSLTRIGDNTFLNCKNLQNIIFPNSLLSIGRQAFASCKSITGELVIPDRVKVISHYSFHLCSEITSLKIGNDVEVIEEGAFRGCSSISSVTFGNHLNSIGNGAFYGCPILSLDFNDGLQSIGNNAFVGSAIKSLKLPSSVISIGDYCFSGSFLSDVRLNEGLVSIGDFAFKGNYLIESLYIPNTVINIGGGALTLGSLGQTSAIKLNRLLVGNGLEEFGPDVTRYVNVGWSFPREVIFGKSIKKISDSGLLHRGTGYGNMPGAIQYLLTDNVVSFSGCPLGRDPDCTIFVADSTKYSENDILKYNIKNIFHSDKYTGEYSGTFPVVHLKSELSGFHIDVDSKYYNVGSYTNIQVTLSNDTITSTITIPCSYVINKAPLTIIPKDKTITYGESIPSFNCIYQGLKNDETPEYALTKLPQITTSASANSDVGTYKIYASGAESTNYSLSYQTGILTIKQASQTIIWNQSFQQLVSDSKIELLATSSCGLKVQYQSSDPSIAYIVEEDGKTYLYTRKDGTITLRASQPGNNNYEPAFNVEKTIIVTPRMAYSIDLNYTNIDMKVGEDYTLIATVLPESTVDKSLEWSSSDNTIATVTNGVVHAINLGEATIFARTKDGSDLTASCNVSVIPTLAESITLSKTIAQLTVGNSEQITATVFPNNTTNKEIVWEVENLSIASVNNGLITAIGIGNTTLKAKCIDGSGVYAICTIIVNPISITSIELSPNNTSINVGDNITLSAIITPADASNQQLLWTSSDNDIASVTNGVVTGKKPGTVVISAQSTDGSNITSSASIKVNDIKATNIYLDKSSMSMCVGDEKVLEVTITPNDVTNKNVIWSTSNSSVAVVDNGTVYAKASGNATITATTTDGTDLSASCQINVDKKNQSISWNQHLVSVQYGGQLVELDATSSSGLKVNYRSSNEDIVTIFDLGDVVYLNPGNCGKVSISAYQEGNNEFYSATEISKEIEVVNSNSNSNKTLIAYYSQSSIIDGIIAELVNQIACTSSSAYTAKIEPLNHRINDAFTNIEVRDSVMNALYLNPNDITCYPELKPINVNVNDYDAIIMVYPLWNNDMAAPMQTFCFTNKTVMKNKSIAYIEYDLLGDSGTSANAKVLRLNASDLNDKEDMIREWLNHTEETGILHINQAKSNTIKGIYDLQGRKLQKTPNEGLYIIKGHKIVIKNGRVN